MLSFSLLLQMYPILALISSKQCLTEQCSDVMSMICYTGSIHNSEVESM